PPNSAIATVRPNKSGADSLPTSVPFHYTQSESFIALLHQLGASLLVSTYQANKLLVVRADGGGLSTLVRSFERPMGMAVSAGRLPRPRRSAAPAGRGVWPCRPAAWPWGRTTPSGCCATPRTSHHASSQRADTTLASCRVRATSPATLPCMSWRGSLLLPSPLGGEG